MVTATNAYGLNGNTSSTLSDQVTPSSTPVSDNKDMFTKLLVAQIRNQDPLAPSDPSEFVNQLSQLSQTEALQNLTATTAASAGVLQSLQVLAMGAQVSSNVSVSTSRVQLDGAALSGTVQLGGASTLTHLVLTDVAGKQTRVELPPHGAGAQSFTLDPAALGLAAGKYSIAAESSDGTKPGIEIDGRLESVRLASSGAIVMQVSGVGEVEPGLITGFNGKSTPAALASLSTEN